ncbi:MAG: DUF2283 domain-containing protein [Thermoflexia bacterium]|nr:MAG: DUF2283 domain-containing protein [Thermoflexia bacterium]
MGRRWTQMKRGRFCRMRITRDLRVDALYIRFIDEPVGVITHRPSEDVAINYVPDGRVVGIEVLDASEYVFPAQERRIVVQNMEVVPA